MKIKKTVLAVILCAAVAFALTGCNNQPLPQGDDDVRNPEKTEAPAESAQSAEKAPDVSAYESTSQDVQLLMTPLEDYGLTVDNLYWSNLLSYLLNDYGSVKIVSVEEGVKYVEGYFSCDERQAGIFTAIYPDGTMESNGCFDRFYFTFEEDRVVASVYVEYLADEEYIAVDLENVVNNYFMDAQAAVITADDSGYTMFVSNFFNDYIVTVDRATLDITKAEYDRGDGVTHVSEYIYGEFVEGAELFDCWNGAKKNVTIVAELYDGDSVTRTERTFEMAADWELVPESWDELALYADADYTIPYEYPGYGQDYTVYATNAMG